MSARLTALWELCLPATTIADVGCDHGKIAEGLLQRDICEFAVLSDISAASLAKAQKRMKQQGLLPRTTFLIADGIAALPACGGYVIAGMGGKLIAQILALGIGSIGTSYLILQPNKNVQTLRARLRGLGLVIEAERIVREDRRYYPILRVRAGVAQPLTSLEILLGPRNIMAARPETAAYASHLLRLSRKVLAGLPKGHPATAYHWERIELLEQYLSVGRNAGHDGTNIL